MKSIARFCAIGLMTGFAVMSLGCVAGSGSAAGPDGTVSYVEGASTGLVKATPREALAAAKKAFDGMDIYITSQRSSKTSAELVGKTSDDTNVTVHVRLNGQGVSEVSIRIGIFGDRDLSDTLFAHLKEQLKKSP